MMTTKKERSKSYSARRAAAYRYDIGRDDRLNLIERKRTEKRLKEIEDKLKKGGYCK